MRIVKRIIGLVFFSTFLFAQVKIPQPSPLGTVTQVVGITEISITYSRPGIKGRQIFGGLVPYGQVWRTGANASTKLKTDQDIMLEGHTVPAGEYSIYTVPGEREWKIIINKKLDSGRNYIQEEDLLSFKVKPRLVPLPVERFTIDIADMTDNSAVIVFKWAQTEVPINLTVDTDKLVHKSIKDFLDSDKKTARGYYMASRYYFDHDIDLDDASDFVDKSIELDENSFTALRLKAEIMAKKGDYEEALLYAKKSLVKAQQAGNDEFVKLNEASITEWQNKK